MSDQQSEIASKAQCWTRNSKESVSESSAYINLDKKFILKGELLIANYKTKKRETIEIDKWLCEKYLKYINWSYRIKLLVIAYSSDTTALLAILLMYEILTLIDQKFFTINLLHS